MIISTQLYGQSLLKEFIKCSSIVFLLRIVVITT